MAFSATAVPTQTPSEPALLKHQEAASQLPAGRLQSVDALRGFDMFWIVGGRELVYDLTAIWQKPVPDWVEYHLGHPDWIGFSAWDMIMPLFLFVVGVAMPFSFAHRKEAGLTNRELSWKIVRRTAILFVLGMAVQGHLFECRLETLDLYCNTLQAIACGYLVSSFLLLNTGIRFQFVTMVVMLLGYWAALMWIPLGGFSAGSLEPNANLALAVDELLLRQFRDGTAYTWILTGMSFTAMVLLGVMAGHLLRSNRSPLTKGMLLIAAGLLCVALGWAWEHWGHYPIIKHIWTGSMVLWAAGWSYLLLALFYLVIDVAGYRRWSFPFVVIGMNAITIYVAVWFVPFRGIAERFSGGLASHLGAAGPAVNSAATVLLVWLLVYHLYRQRIFLRV